MYQTTGLTLKFNILNVQPGVSVQNDCCAKYLVFLLHARQSVVVTCLSLTSEVGGLNVDPDLTLLVYKCL